VNNEFSAVFNGGWLICWRPLNFCHFHTAQMVHNKLIGLYRRQPAVRGNAGAAGSESDQLFGEINHGKCGSAVRVVISTGPAFNLVPASVDF
jgi:hypothetical protein